MLFARHVLLLVAVVAVRTVDALAARPANLRRLQLSAQCSTLSSTLSTQYSQLPDSACGALPAGSFDSLFSVLEPQVPGCDLSSAKAAFNSPSSCSALTSAFETYCNAVSSCASGGSSTGGDSGGSTPAPASSPSPPAPPPPPKTIGVELQVNANSVDDITTAMKTTIKDTFVTYLKGKGVSSASRADIALSVGGVELADRRKLHDVARRLQGTLAVDVTMTVPPSVDDGAIADDLSSTATQDSLKTTMSNSGVDVASMAVTSSKKKSSDNTGVIVGAVVGSIVGVLLLGALVYMCMKKKAVVDVKAAA